MAGEALEEPASDTHCSHTQLWRCYIWSHPSKTKDHCLQTLRTSKLNKDWVNQGWTDVSIVKIAVLSKSPEVVPNTQMTAFIQL